MTKPQKYRDVARFLHSKGWEKRRQVGSHEIWQPGTGEYTLPLSSTADRSPQELSARFRRFPRHAPELEMKGADVMNQTHTYLARAYREEGGWWTVEVPELTSAGPKGTTIIAKGGAITTRGIDKAARELVASWLDVPQDTVRVNVSIEIPEEISRLWAQGETADAEGRAAVERGAVLRRQAVRELRAHGYTLEAAAAALGVSHQRIQQLTKA